MAHRPPAGSTRCTAESEAFQLAVADALAIREIQDGVAATQNAVTEIWVAAAAAEPVAEPIAVLVAEIQIGVAEIDRLRRDPRRACGARLRLPAAKQ